MDEQDNKPRAIIQAKKPTLSEAVRKTAESFDSSPLNARFEMTIEQGWRVFNALHKVHKALSNLDKAADEIRW